MKSLFGLFVFLATFSVIPLLVYLVGYALQSQVISRFGIGVGKLLFIAQSWFFFYAICLHSYEAFNGGVLVARNEVMFALMGITASIYGLVIVGLVRRNKLSFFK